MSMVRPLTILALRWGLNCTWPRRVAIDSELNCVGRSWETVSNLGPPAGVVAQRAAVLRLLFFLAVFPKDGSCSIGGLAGPGSIGEPAGPGGAGKKNQSSVTPPGKSSAITGQTLWSLHSEKRTHPLASRMTMTPVITGIVPL